MPLFSLPRYACSFFFLNNFLRIITASLLIRFLVDFDCFLVDSEMLNLLRCYLIPLLSINMELFSILVLKICGFMLPYWSF